MDYPPHLTLISTSGRRDGRRSGSRSRIYDDWTAQRPARRGISLFRGKDAVRWLSPARWCRRHSIPKTGGFWPRTVLALQPSHLESMTPWSFGVKAMRAAASCERGWRLTVCCPVMATALTACTTSSRARSSWEHSNSLRDGIFVPSGAPYAYEAGPGGAVVLEFRPQTSFDMQIPGGQLERWRRMAVVAEEHGGVGSAEAKGHGVTSSPRVVRDRRVRLVGGS